MQIKSTLKPIILSMATMMISVSTLANIECSVIIAGTSQGATTNLRNYLKQQRIYSDNEFQEGRNVATLIIKEAAGNSETFSRLINLAMTESPLQDNNYFVEMLKETRDHATSMTLTSSQKETIEQGIKAAIVMRPNFRVYLEKYAHILWGTTKESKVAETNLRNYLKQQRIYSDNEFQEGRNVATLIIKEAAGNSETFSRLINLAMTESPLQDNNYFVEMLKETREYSQNLLLTEEQILTITSGIRAAIVMRPNFRVYLEKYASLLWGA